MPKRASPKNRTLKVKPGLGMNYLSRSPFSERTIWLARGLEVAMVLYSLFGTIEVNAIETQKAKQQRGPTSIRELRLREPNTEFGRKLAAVSKATQFKDKSQNGYLKNLKSNPFIAPQTIYFGENISPAFRANAFYVNTAFTVFRIPVIF